MLHAHSRTMWVLLLLVGVFNICLLGVDGLQYCISSLFSYLSFCRRSIIKNVVLSFPQLLYKCPFLPLILLCLLHILWAQLFGALYVYILDELTLYQYITLFFVSYNRFWPKVYFIWYSNIGPAIFLVTICMENSFASFYFQSVCVFGHKKDFLQTAYSWAMFFNHSINLCLLIR